MRLAVPDLVSSSYFPALAAAQLPASEQTGVPLTLEHIFPIRKAVEALRDGAVDLVAGPAHAALFAFPGWHGAKIVMALSQHTYWLLVVRPDLDLPPGTVEGVHDLTIAAAPGPGHALRQLLLDSGVDLESQRVTIAPLPESHATGGSFGVRAARALSDGVIDAFWANSMAAETAVRQGAGRVQLDPRRGDGPATASRYTFPALLTSDRVLADRHDDVRAVVRSVVSAQGRLRDDPGLATTVAAQVFPSYEAGLIEDLVRRDLPHYSPAVSEDTVTGLNDFTMAIGMATAPAGYGDVVALDLVDAWQESP
jgi:ABC-type nitrate/sulfonate/bicarbonate transport system substrate-binding protein